MQDPKNIVFQMRFPQKLWYLLNMKTDAIFWGGTGRTILLNYNVLQTYLQCNHSIFKTTNIASFVRQLNLYGFRKVTSHLQDPLCNSSNPFMHEYIHDYFQYGRPELLNKISRKALAFKKTFKPRMFRLMADQPCLTPLEKARRALRLALKKAAEDLLMKNSPNKPVTHIKIEYNDPHIVQEHDDDEEETDGLEWFKSNSHHGANQDNCQPASSQDEHHTMEETAKFIGQQSQQNMMNFNKDNNESSSQNLERFPSGFLNMPDLDHEPEDTADVELLAEFNICHKEEKIATKEKEKSFLNCVLPSVGKDQIEDVSISEREYDASCHYQAEWDMMFNDIIINKNSSQESESELKETYFHISKTIDLLNS